MIASALPLTGQCTKTPTNPYDPPKRLTESEELKLRLEEIATLPDRVAYFWYKAELAQAIPLQTPYLPPPHQPAGCTADELARFAEQTPLGQGVSPQIIQQTLEAQVARWQPTQQGTRKFAVPPKSAPQASPRTLEETLEEEYG